MIQMLVIFECCWNFISVHGSYVAVDTWMLLGLRFLSFLL
jgi:hypothetical protein